MGRDGMCGVQNKGGAGAYQTVYQMTSNTLASCRFVDLKIWQPRPPPSDRLWIRRVLAPSDGLTGVWPRLSCASY